MCRIFHNGSQQGSRQSSLLVRDTDKYSLFISRNGGEFAAPNVIGRIHLLLQISEKKIHGKLFSLVPCSMQYAD